MSQVKHGQLKITAVIHLIASEELVEKRLLDRGRTDDNKEAIAERFNEYEESIKPILAHFKKAGVIVHDVSAEHEVQAIHRQISSLIREAYADES